MRPVVIDTETTGIDKEQDKLVEVAVVWHEGDWLEKFELLCNPHRPIPPEAKAVHHITEKMVADSPTPEIAVERVLRVAGGDDTIWVAHNAQFDRGFLELLSPVFAPVERWICTWRCALHVWPDAPSHSNQVLRYWLGLELDDILPKDLAPHRALYDTIVTMGILRCLNTERSLEQLIDLSTKPALLKTVRFGKHRGMLWKDLPKDYLRWVAVQRDMDSDARHTAMYWLRGQDELRL